MKKGIIAYSAMFAALLLASGWVANKKAQVAYADTPCPLCGSGEVLDYGHTENGERCKCYDCKAEFYIKERKP